MLESFKKFTKISNLLLVIDNNFISDSRVNFCAKVLISKTEVFNILFNSLILYLKLVTAKYRFISL